MSQLYESYPSRRHKGPSDGDPRRPARRLRATITSALGALALLAVAVEPGAAQSRESAAAKTLPDRWHLSEDGKILTWDALEPIPVLDALIQVRINDRLAVVPTISKDRRHLSIALPAHVKDLSALSVTTAGRRLDQARKPLAASRLLAAESADPAAAAAALPTLTTLPDADDPGRPGPYTTVEGEYDEAPLTVRGLKVPVEVRAVVVAPVGAPGPQPVALFLHGNHATCYSPTGALPEAEALTWPCGTGALPVPNHRGYLETQRLLASQGVITISISANSINAQTPMDTDVGAVARAALVRAHLAKWQRGAAGFSASAANVVRGLSPDLTRLLLVGHSRGGEGVNRFAIDNVTDPSSSFRVQGQVLIGPTLLRRNPAPGVPSVVLLPACDGDVALLDGQHFADGARDITADTALRSILYVEGANHNYFNAQWTPGIGPDASDDWLKVGKADDSACGSSARTRLSPAAQRTVGAVYTAAAAQAFLFGRAAVAPLLDGTPVRARSAGAVTVRAHALGAYRTPLLVPSATTTLTGTLGVTARRCLTARWPNVADTCLTGGIATLSRTPSFGPSLLLSDPDLPSATALYVQWSRRTGQARIQIDGALDSQATAVAARVIVPPQSTSVAFSARLVDKSGKTLSLGRTSLGGLPSRASAASGAAVAQEVRFPLSRAAATSAGIDLTQLAALEFVPESLSGELWLLDAWGYRAGLPKAEARSVARVDLEDGTALETDGKQVVLVPASISGRLQEPAVVHYEASDATGWRQVGSISLAAGRMAFDIPLELEGDDVEMGPRFIFVQIAGIRGVVTGTPTSFATLIDDEPTPDITVTPHAEASEGAPLSWTFSLPRPSARTLTIYVNAVAPSTGRPELTLADFEAGSSDTTPLSASGYADSVTLWPGELSATLDLSPAVQDAQTEGAESIAFEIVSTPPGTPVVSSLRFAPLPGLPDGTRLTGTITDAP